MREGGAKFEVKAPGARLLMVVAPYYGDIADKLQRGAEAAAEESEATIERIFVPGAFEIPAAIAHAAKRSGYEGFVALGCVVRGDTSHYDYVCGESARALMDLSVREDLSIGYGILTVNTIAQAEERADPKRGDKGGEATRAALAMIALKRRFAGIDRMNEAEIDARRAARLGAVQALYQMEVSGASTADVIAEFDAGKLPRETEASITESEGDPALFKTIVEKAVERQATLDRAIARHLSKGWRLERLDAVARAILRAGSAELEQRADIPVAVVIDEYVEIAKSFFDGPEPGFVNATLDACARDLRPIA